jgi:small subunit ribosomal protein S16
MDVRQPRDGKVIEELGYYDPMVKETDARAVLNGERIDYWLSVGAQPTEKVKMLIKKYGTNGTHLAQQALALERLKIRPQAPPPAPIPRPAPAETSEPVTEASEPATEASEPATEGSEPPTEAETNTEPGQAPPAEEPKGDGSAQ